MKLKIVIMVCMPCDKSKTKAMEVTAKAAGVISVGIAGDYADRLEVVGDGVDPVCLVGRLRKKVGWAEILQVQEEKVKKTEDQSPEGNKEPLQPLPLCYPDCYHCPLAPQCYPSCNHCPPVPQVVICDESGPSCSIM